MIISDGGCVPICVVFISKTSPWKDCRFTSEWLFIAMRYASRHSPKQGFIQDVPWGGVQRVYSLDFYELLDFNESHKSRSPD